MQLSMQPSIKDKHLNLTIYRLFLFEFRSVFNDYYKIINKLFVNSGIQKYICQQEKLIFSRINNQSSIKTN